MVTGGAWLSSARVVRCWVKSRNERNPRYLLVFRHLIRLPAMSWRRERMRSSQHAPYILGDTHATMVNTKRSLLAKVGKPQKIDLNSDCWLQLANMKLESLVIVGQPYDGEYVLGPCTHRPSLRQNRIYPKSIYFNKEVV